MLLHALVLAAVQAPPPPPDSAPTRDLFGVSVDAAGDRDGDGVPDLWVGDPSVFGPTGHDRGSAWCISGSDGSTLLRIATPPGSRKYGWTIVGLGDVDADGVRDVAVGCMFIDQPHGEPATHKNVGVFESSQSAVHVHSGRDGALKFVIRGAADLVKEPWYSTAAGPSLANVSDWNADGADDLAIGWSYADGDWPDQGRVQVVSGRDGSTLHEWYGLEQHDRFGFALARVADVDGDGVLDLAASAVPDHNGAPTAPDSLRRNRSGYVRILSSKGDVLRTIHPFDGSRCFGFSLAAFPKSLDGTADGVIVGQAHDGNARYAVTRWNLNDGSFAQLATKPPLDTWDGGWKRTSVSPPHSEVNESFATRVMAVPDRDGDGRADVLVTEPQALCHVPAGVISSKRDPDPSGSLVAVPIGRIELGDRGVWYSHVGIACCAPGDLDGDGVEDVVLSGASVRCGDCAGTVHFVSGKTLKVLRTFTRAGRE